jgi:hypothetical protein
MDNRSGAASPYKGDNIVRFCSLFLFFVKQIGFSNSYEVFDSVSPNCLYLSEILNPLRMNEKQSFVSMFPFSVYV